VTGGVSGLTRRALSGARRFVLATSATPLRHLWLLGYAVTGRVVGRQLARRYGATVYLRGAGAGGAFQPGLSDIDLLAVAAPTALLPEPPRERHLGGLVQVDIYRAADLAAIVPSTSTTFGLGTFATAYHGEGSPRDPTGLLDRPGLPHDATRWRHLAGPSVRVVVPDADRQTTLDAAWSELLTWWRFALEALHCPEPLPSHAYLCVKLVAEPLRVLLALDGRAVQGRDQALALGPTVAPELADQIARARALLHDLHRSPEPPFESTIPVLVALSRLVARRIDDELTPGERVRLEGAPTAAPPPLADWRALVAEALPAKSLLLAEGSPESVSDLRRLNPTDGEDVQAFLSGELLFEPTAEPWYVGRARVLQSSFSDPVSFALGSGSRTAVFPAARGWSATDWARRAVAERSAWLGEAGRAQIQPAGWPRPPDAAAATAAVVGHLLASARAALLLLSLTRGEPVLLLGAEAVAAAIGDAAAGALDSVHDGEPPRLTEVDALRESVRGLLGQAVEDDSRGRRSTR